MYQIYLNYYKRLLCLQIYIKIWNTMFKKRAAHFLIGKNTKINKYFYVIQDLDGLT